MENNKMYEAKSNYALAKNRENAELLTPELAVKMANITITRHALHSHNAEGNLFNGESANYQAMWDNYATIAEYVSEPSVWEECPMDSDWHEWMSDEDKLDYEVDIDGRPDSEDDMDDYISSLYDIFVDCSLETIRNRVEILNTKCELKLAEFDEEYGTSYCPSGASRF